MGGAFLSKIGFAFVCFLLTLVHTPVATGLGNASLETTLDALLKQTPRVTPRALLMSLSALKRLQAAGTAVRLDRLMLIDYTRPSSEPRLWVFDLHFKRLLFEEPVAHGRNSGEDRCIRFSNAPGSLMSCLGVFLTADTYIGKHGLSLRLRGMEEGINDLSMERNIVIHAASYVRLSGRIGRSWGCPAVRPEIARALIEAVRGGTLLLSYYPEQSWLQASRLARTPVFNAASLLQNALH
jgi:hypothetical protein